MSRYLELLEASSKRVGSSLCVGIDPDPSQFPSTYASSPDGVRQWVQLLVRASEPYAAAYKVEITRVANGTVTATDAYGNAVSCTSTSSADDCTAYFNATTSPVFTATPAAGEPANSSVTAR